MEIRAKFGIGIITAFIRVEGRPMGVIANNPHHLSGAIEDPEARLAEFKRRTEIAYDSAKAVNAAAGGGIDDVIDPADTRRWIVNGLKHLPPVPPRTGKKYPYIDPW